MNFEPVNIFFNNVSNFMDTFEIFQEFYTLYDEIDSNFISSFCNEYLDCGGMKYKWRLHRLSKLLDLALETHNNQHTDFDTIIKMSDKNLIRHLNSYRFTTDSDRNRSPIEKNIHEFLAFVENVYINYDINLDEEYKLYKLKIDIYPAELIN